MELPIEWLPADGSRPEQLMLLLHGVGSDGVALAPLAQVLRSEYPQAAILAPDAPHAFDGGGCGHQWFSVQGITEDNRADRVAAALGPLLRWVRAQQDRLLVPPVATALVGFSQGAILSLEAVLAADGIAGRVLSFSGRFVALPTAAPQYTTLHFFHGSADAVTPVAHTQMAIDAMQALQGDATMDIAQGVGHELHPALVQRAIWRLRHHIPARTWAAALGATPPGLRSSEETED